MAKTEELGSEWRRITEEDVTLSDESDECFLTLVYSSHGINKSQLQRGNEH